MAQVTLSKKGLLALISLVLIGLFMIQHRQWFSPDQFFVVALIVAIFLKKGWDFLKSWTIPVSLLLIYDYLRGALPHLAEKPHVTPMITFSRALTGRVWIRTLQMNLYTGKTSWYDYFLSSLYISHFIIPMITAFYFWMTSRDLFRSYFSCLILVSYMALITFVLFPTMPPWLAGDNGYIKPLEDILNQTIIYFPQPLSLPTVYRYIDDNLVAAVPSLHAAYATLTLIFLSRRFKKFIPLFLIYFLSLCFSLMYLGQHYLLDIVIGILYTVIAYILVQKFPKLFIKWDFSFLRRIYKFLPQLGVRVDKAN
jgi:membrane-associated phospholipid phosphatase